MIDRRQYLAGSVAIATTGCVFDRLTVEAPATGIPGDRFSIDDLCRRTFDWFWDLADPRTGLVPDRWPTPSFASIAAVGFALPVYAWGAEMGWVSRSAARDRTLVTLQFFASSSQGDAEAGVTGHRGFYYHFLDMKTGARFEETELSSIDTALLMGGVLFAAEYFDRTDPAEARIRALATALLDSVDWRWMQQPNGFVSMGWRPADGFIPHYWDTYNEAMLLNLLALGSATHALAPALWPRLTDRFAPHWGEHWGETYLHFPPLFGHQYSHMFVDFRGIRDSFIAAKGIDYFENSARAVRAQRNYAIANPGGWAGYSSQVWGLTACDGPGDFTTAIDGRTREFFSYSARGPGDRDDGTLSPTALGGSLPFAPDIVGQALGAIHKIYGSAIYGRYGFLDSFNPTLKRQPDHALRHGKIVEDLCWVDGDYLGIDQGPIVGMIANHQADFIWKHTRKSKILRRGLERAGFSGGWLAG